MRVGALYAVLRLEKNQFDAALTTSETKFGKFMGVLRAGGLLAAQGLAVIAAGSIAMAAVFEQHMQQSLAIMGNVTEDVRKRMETAAREVAKTSTFSAAQAADAYYFLASAGYTAEQSISALPVVTRFAQAGVMDLDKATELLMDTQTTMGLRTKDATKNMENMARVSDVLSKAAIQSNATLQQMAEALVNKAGPALRNTNKSIEEGAAVLEVLANRGLKGRAAGTALGIVLRELQTKALKNKDAFKELNVAVFDSHGKMRNMADIIGDLENALKGQTDAQKKAILMQLGFTDRSVGFIQTLLGTSSQIRQYQKDLEGAGGTTKEVAEKQLQTLWNQMKILWHVIEDVALTIGQKMMPGVKDMITGVTDWLKANEDLIASIVGGLFSALGQLFDIIGKVADVIITALKPMFDSFANDTLPAVGDALGSFIDDYLVYAQEMINLFVTGVLPILLDLFRAFAEDVLPAVADVLQWFGETVLPAFAAGFTWIVTNILPPLRDLFVGIFNWFKENWPTIFTIVKDVFEAIRVVVSIVVPIIWGIIKPIASVLFPLIGTAASVLLGVIKFVFDAIGVVWNGTAAAAKVVGDAIGAAFRWLGDFFSGLWGGITSTFKGAINFIIELVNGFIRFMNDIHFDIPKVDIGPIHLGGGTIDPFNIPLIPKLAKGTKFFQGGMAWVGEQGPELVNLPRGSQVFPAGQSSMMRGDVTVTIRDPDGAIARGGYDQGHLEKMMEEALLAATGAARHRSLRMATR